MSNKVSIILTVYNKPEWLNECIDSVLEQTYENWELIIMEDNSPDIKVKQILDSYDDERIIKHFSNISEKDRYKTARYATLINEAFPMTNGKYITYLVDDDKYFPHRLETLVAYMDSNPDHEVVYHPLANIDAGSGIAGVRGIKGILDGIGDDSHAFNYVDHNMVMHTRKAFTDVEGWYDDPGVWGGADAYFWRKLNQAGYKFYPVGSNDDPLAGKRYHERNVQALIVRGEFPPKEVND